MKARVWVLKSGWKVRGALVENSEREREREREREWSIKTSNGPVKTFANKH